MTELPNIWNSAPALPFGLTTNDVTWNPFHISALPILRKMWSSASARPSCLGCQRSEVQLLHFSSARTFKGLKLCFRISRFLVGPFVYFHTLCERTAKAGRLCDKYHNLMSWLKCAFGNSSSVAIGIGTRVIEIVTLLFLLSANFMSQLNRRRWFKPRIIPYNVMQNKSCPQI